MRLHLHPLLLCALAIGGAPSPAAQRYDGLAFIRGGNRVAYRETDWLFTRGGVAQRLVLYRCPDGSPFARKWVTDSPDGTAPDFEFDDGRDGYREGVRTQEGARQVFLQDGGGAALVAHALPAEPNGVIDAGFDAFVRAHWHELASGGSRRIPFLIPDRFKFMDFTIAGAHDAVLHGHTVRVLKLSLSAWYGFALPSIDLAYDVDGRRLEQYQGIGTIRDAAGHHQDVRIEFPPQLRAGEVPDDEVDRAAAARLGARCGG